MCSRDGVDRFEARKRVVELMEVQGLLDKIEPDATCRATWRPLRRGA